MSSLIVRLSCWVAWFLVLLPSPASADDGGLRELRALFEGKANVLPSGNGEIQLNLHEGSDNATIALAAKKIELRSQISIVLISAESMGDAALSALAECPNIQCLYVSDRKKWTPATSRLILRLKHLKRLRAQDMELCEGALGAIAELKGLDELFVDGSHFKKDDWSKLKTLVDLKVLSLSRTTVTDDDISLLRKMSALEWLYLTDTKISDKSIVDLEKMKSLKIVAMSNTAVTEKGAQRLGSALPEAFVTWSEKNKGSVIIRGKDN